MRTFDYVIRDELSLHFGPAGRMAELAGYYEDTAATIEMGTRSADIRRPMKVALMGIRKGDKVTVICSGPSEVELLDVLYQYFEEHM